jgi:peptidoglycan/LPS O-acetylase OafA/YrhL
MGNWKILNRSSEHYAFMDGIRAMAVLWVIVFHSWLFQYVSMGDAINGIYNHPLFYWVTKGDLGVDLFFVISGFLIGSIIFKEIKNTDAFHFTRFYVRRFLRLTPVYVFSMGLNMYFMKDFGENQFGIYWSNILYVSNYVASSPMAWTWSLAIEEQFYMVVPFLLVYIFPKFKNKLLFFGTLAALSIYISWYYVYIKMDFTLPFNLTLLTPNFNRWFRGYYVYTHLRFIGLLIGVAVAYLNVYKIQATQQFFEQNKKAMPLITLLIVAVLIGISFTPVGEWAPMQDSIFIHINVHIGKWYEILCRPVYSAGVGFVILACIYSKNAIINPINQFLSAKFFYPIAQVSYSAYLFHEMFIIWSTPKLHAFLIKSYSTQSIFIISVVVFAAAILIGAVAMYYLIEQPFQKIRNKIKFN